MSIKLTNHGFEAEITIDTVDKNMKNYISMFKEKSMRKCPKCESQNVATERRPNGDSKCLDCGHSDPTLIFDYPEQEKEKIKRPRYNCYVCEHHCQTFTVDVDKGVTPFMIPCEFKGRPDRPANPKYIGKNGKCIGMARSCFYPKDPLPSHAKVSHEWYKPNFLELKHFDFSSGEREHVKRGGLLLRERTDKEPVYHDD